MIFLRRLIAVILLLALHFGLSSLVHTGWAFSILVVCIVLFVWRDMRETTITVILPAALLIDIISSNRFPVLTVSSLGVWIIISMLQSKWLTNHSIASLMGMAFVGIVVHKVLFVICIIFANILSLSQNTLSQVWDTKSVLAVGVAEFLAIMLFGLLLKSWNKFFGFRLLYGSR